MGENKEFERQVLAGELDLELIPQGTLAEKVARRRRRDSGLLHAHRLRHPTGRRQGHAGLRRHRICAGDGIRADVAIVKAWRGDTAGNLVYRKTARNFNPMIATCGNVTVAEVEELVEVGELDPDLIHTPGIYVDRIIEGPATRSGSNSAPPAAAPRSRTTAPSASSWPSVPLRELRDGYYVNLGIGIPTLVANFIPDDINVTLQSENGLLGIGAYPADDQVDRRPHQRRQTDHHHDRWLQLLRGADSFAMIRGGHIDLSILGGLEVAENGDLANWMVPGKMVKGPGGAMDLVSGVKRVIVIMDHTAKDGSPKILKQCTLPLTGKGVVDMVITDLCVFDVDPDRGLTLTELHPGVTVAEVRAKTGCDFIVA